MANASLQLEALPVQSACTVAQYMRQLLYYFPTDLFNSNIKWNNKGLHVLPEGFYSFSSDYTNISKPT